MDNDTSWCPVCDRQIQPKRFLVPIPPPPPAPPAPPPSSPVRRSKHNATIRQKSGLVRGTGRLKPSGSIKRSDAKNPVVPPAPAPPIKHRLVIDQGPTPLYCSDECQMADLNRGLPHDYNPDRELRSFSPVSFSSRATTDTGSASSSVESQSSLESSHSRTQVSPSLAKLAAMYNFSPFPPPAPVDDEFDDSASHNLNDYSSGVMMAAHRMAQELSPPPPKKDLYGRIIREPRKPIPGWTDGSNAWRDSIYSLSAPKSQKSFASRSSIGIQSTLTSIPLPTPPVHSRRLPSVPHPTTTSDSDSEMLYKFSQSFTRCASRTSLASSHGLRMSPSSIASSPAAPSPTKRERPLIQRGVEGKLLVPEVMIRTNSSVSTTSLSSDWSVASSQKSPLSQTSMGFSEDDGKHRRDSATSLFRPKRPAVEMRSWSYDNVKTYPVMQLPPKVKLEKRKEIRVVDGEEVEVEVEVEVVVVEKLKRLFLFEPKPARRA